MLHPVHRSIDSRIAGGGGFVGPTSLVVFGSIPYQVPSGRQFRLIRFLFLCLGCSIFASASSAYPAPNPTSINSRIATGGCLLNPPSSVVFLLNRLSNALFFRDANKFGLINFFFCLHLLLLIRIPSSSFSCQGVQEVIFWDHSSSFLSVSIHFRSCPQISFSAAWKAQFLSSPLLPFSHLPPCHPLPFSYAWW